MPRNGSGVYSLPEAAFVFNTVIDETVMNNQLSDIESALSASLAADGQKVPTANLPMGNFRHTGVANASARTDYAAAGQVQDSSFLWGGTSGGTANAQTIALTPAITAYAAGQTFRFIAGATNTGATTIAVNGLAATDITYLGNPLTGGEIASGGVYEVIYGGSDFHLVSSTKAPLVRGQLNGLELSNNATDSDHDIDIATGAARDSANAINLELGTALTKQIDASWASGDDAGGLSSSLTIAADTWYYVHLIIVSGSVDVGFDTSLTAANLVTDHSATAYRRIGAVRTDSSSNIIAFHQHGDFFRWDTLQLDVSDTSTTTTAAGEDYTLSAPPNMFAEIAVEVDGVSINQARAYLCPTEAAEQQPTGDTAIITALTQASGASSTKAGSQATIYVDGSSQIRGNTGNASVDLYITTVGWTDYRGKFD